MPSVMFRCMSPCRLRGTTGRRTAPLLALSLLLGGCAATETTSGSDPLAPALSAYYAGDHDSAREQAERVARRTSGEDRHSAEYVAGLASYRAGRNATATRWLTQAMAAEDPELVARARATLGLLHLEDGDPHTAAQELASAAIGLHGDEQARAMSAARRARRAAGLAAGSDPTRSGPSGEYTLQIGAFSSLARAESAQRTAAVSARSAGLGQPHVTKHTDRHNARLFLVQVGSFPTRDAAAAARNRHGLSRWMVAQGRQGDG